MNDGDLQLAHWLVRKAAEPAMAHYKVLPGIDIKESFANPVTVADREAEAAVQALLAEQRPEDGLLGEEGALVNPEASRQWILDPLDGTLNYIKHLPGWCSAVALLEDGQPKVSAIYEPLTERLWSAEAGAGATEGIEQLIVRDCIDLERSLVHLELTPFAFDLPSQQKIAEIAQAVSGLRALGSASVSLSLLANGQLDAWLGMKTPAWDWQPGALIVQEAGGVLFSEGDWNGAAATPELAEALQTLIHAV